MNFKNYETVSADIRKQIDVVCEIWKKHLQDNLIGVYIHGSMVLDCFVEGTSDIDMLIVVDRHIPREERLQIVKEIIDNDVKPSPLEMSAIWDKDLKPWVYPTPCQFHYSDFWTERYQKLLQGIMKDCFIVDDDFCDPDIACHVKLTKQSGVCAYGKPIREVFPEVPEKDFWASISNEIEDYDFNTYNPRYFVSNILILGRILSYKVEKRILSKYEGGLWMLERVPEKYKYIVESSLKVWYDRAEPVDFAEADLKELREFLVNEITAV